MLAGLLVAMVVVGLDGLLAQLSGCAPLRFIRRLIQGSAPAPMGRAYRVVKRTSHVHIYLNEKGK